MRRAHNVFHVSKLKKYVRFDEDISTLSVVIDADGTVEQELKRILPKNGVDSCTTWYSSKTMTQKDALWIVKDELANCKEPI